MNTMHRRHRAPGLAALLLTGAATGWASSPQAPAPATLAATMSQDFAGSYSLQCSTDPTRPDRHTLLVNADGSARLDGQPLLDRRHPGTTGLIAGPGPVLRLDLNQVASLLVNPDGRGGRAELHGRSCALYQGSPRPSHVDMAALLGRFAMPWQALLCGGGFRGFLKGRLLGIGHDGTIHDGRSPHRPVFYGLDRYAVFDSNSFSAPGQPAGGYRLEVPIRALAADAAGDQDAHTAAARYQNYAEKLANGFRDVRVILFKADKSLLEMDDQVDIADGDSHCTLDGPAPQGAGGQPDNW